MISQVYFSIQSRRCHPTGRSAGKQLLNEMAINHLSSLLSFLSSVAHTKVDIARSASDGNHRYILRPHLAVPCWSGSRLFEPNVYRRKYLLTLFVPSPNWSRKYCARKSRSEGTGTGRASRHCEQTYVITQHGRQ